MKVEIEVSDDDIRNGIKRKIKDYIGELATNYYIEQNIKKLIDKYWESTVESITREELANSDKLREKIQKSIENKLRAQLTAIMKEIKE